MTSAKCLPVSLFFFLILLGTELSRAQIQPYLPFPLDRQTLSNTCTQEITNATKEIDAIVNETLRTFDNTVKRFDQTIFDLTENTKPSLLMARLATDINLQEQARTCRTDVETFIKSQYANARLYKVLQPFLNPRTHNQGPEIQTLVTTLQNKFRDGGALLDDALRQDQLEDLKTLGEKKEFFDQNLTGQVLSHGIDVSNYNAYWNFMRTEPNENARREVYVARMKRGENNVSVLEEILDLRNRMAKRVGYTTFADQVLNNNMMAPRFYLETVLNTLTPIIQEKFKDELGKLKAIKCPNASPGNCSFGPYDLEYYKAKYVAQELNVKNLETKLQECLSVSSVLKALFNYVQQNFGLTFRKQNALPKGVTAWADKIDFYDVSDSSGNNVGHVYFDLYHRLEKAWGFTSALRSARPNSNILPVVLLSTNFSPDETGNIFHSDVENLFHEFGHVLHALFGKSHFYHTSAFEVKPDFREVPSTTLENLAWTKSMLKEIHPEIPQDILGAKLRSRSLLSGIEFTHLLFISRLDLQFHSTAQIDTTTSAHELYKELYGFKCDSEDYYHGTLTHIVSGEYEMALYAYLIGPVISSALWDSFNPSAFQTNILAPAGTRDPWDLLTGCFSLRPPYNLTPFTKRLRGTLGME